MVAWLIPGRQIVESAASRLGHWEPAHGPDPATRSTRGDRHGRGGFRLLLRGSMNLDFNRRLEQLT
jgi:hypothetical protein